MAVVAYGAAHTCMVQLVRIGCAIYACGVWSLVVLSGRPEFTLSTAAWEDAAGDLPLRYVFAFNTAPDGVDVTSPDGDFQLRPTPSEESTLDGVLLPTAANPDGHIAIGTAAVPALSCSARMVGPVYC